MEIGNIVRFKNSNLNYNKGIIIAKLSKDNFLSSLIDKDANKRINYENTVSKKFKKIFFPEDTINSTIDSIFSANLDI